MNLDPRSVMENIEIGVVIEAADIALAMSEWFDRESSNTAFRLQLETNESGAESIVWHDIEAGEPRVYHSESHAGFWRRVGGEFLRLLPIESPL